eukprot:230253-Alexandrium_andersonii.AAC.1
MGGPQQGGCDDAQRPQSLCGQRRSFLQRRLHVCGHATFGSTQALAAPTWLPDAGAARAAAGVGPERLS